MFKELFHEYGWFLRHYRKYYIMSIICLTICYIQLSFQPWFFGYIADHVAEGHISWAQFRVWACLLFVSVLLLYGCNYVWQYYTYKGADTISLLSRRRLMRLFLGQGQAFFSANPTGSLMGKATNDVKSVDETASFGMMVILDATLYPLILLISMFTMISWKLSLVTILPLPLLMVGAKIVGRNIEERFDAAQKAFDNLNDEVLEQVSGIRLMRAYAREPIGEQRFAEAADQLLEKNMDLVRYSSMMAPLSRIVPGISLILTLIYGIYLIQNGELTSGKLISQIFFLNQLGWPMFSYGELINTASSGIVAMKRIRELLETERVPRDAENARELEQWGTVEVRDLDFCYPGADKNTLSGISFSIPSGHTLGVVGKVGSGKTTLLRQFLRLFEVKADSMLIDGQAIESLSLSSLRGHIAYVPQHAIIFSRTIRENVSLGEDEANLPRDVISALKMAELWDDIQSFNAGIETMAGEEGVTLSGGQRQRLQLARALTRDADFLILDDCLSAVDAKTEERLLAMIRETRRGKSAIISAHRLSLVRDADEIIVLDGGRITERGSHAQLIARGGWYAEQYHRQQMEKEGAAHAID